MTQSRSFQFVKWKKLGGGGRDFPAIFELYAVFWWACDDSLVWFGGNCSETQEKETGAYIHNTISVP